MRGIMSSQLTASQIERARACPASLALPIVTLPSNNDSQRGTAIHRFLEAAINCGHKTALAEIPANASWRTTCENIDIAEIVGEAATLECELSLAYNPFAGTARILGSNIRRNYIDVSEQEIAGTADLVITSPDGRVTVIDYKTGRNPVYVSNSGQPRLLALALARARALSQLSIAIIQIDGAGGYRRDELRLDADDLDRIANSVRVTFTNVMNMRALVARGQTPDVRVGEHCAYCPAFRACPANISLASSLLNNEQNITAAIKELTPKEAGIVWERLTVCRWSIKRFDTSRGC